MSAEPSDYALSARFVFPVGAPPISNGSVVIEGARIKAVGRDISARRTIDFGNAAILPGLINAHTHLEFSDLERPLGEPGMNFADWIRLVIEYRRNSGDAQGTPIENGLRQSAAHGITTLGEITTAAWQIPQLRAAPLRIISFREAIALAESRFDETAGAARAHLDDPNWKSQSQAALSPHAPYSVHPTLFERLMRVAKQKNALAATHVAESHDELRLLRDGDGPLVDLYKSLGVWNPAAIPLGTRPLDTLKRLVRAPRSLVIHGNYLDEEEISLLVRHADRMAVVYCPRTHDFFGHEPYPLAHFLASGATVALGTDSRASNPDLNLLAEMRCVVRKHELPLDEVLHLGTINAARALGLAEATGSIAPGKSADLTVVALPDVDAADPHELLFREDATVTATISNGEPIYGSELFEQLKT